MQMQQPFESVIDMLSAFANVYSIRQSLDIDTLTVDAFATQDEIIAEIVKRMMFNALDNRGATVSVNNIMSSSEDAIDSTAVDYVTTGGLAYGFRFDFSAREGEDEFHAYVIHPGAWTPESTLLARLWLDGWTPSEAMAFEYDSLQARLVLEEEAQLYDQWQAKSEHGYPSIEMLDEEDTISDEEALGTSPLAALRAKMALPIEED